MLSVCRVQVDLTTRDMLLSKMDSGCPLDWTCQTAANEMGLWVLHAALCESDDFEQHLVSMESAVSVLYNIYIDERFRIAAVCFDVAVWAMDLPPQVFAKFLVVPTSTMRKLLAIDAYLEVSVYGEASRRDDTTSQ